MRPLVPCSLLLALAACNLLRPAPVPEVVGTTAELSVALVPIREAVSAEAVRAGLEAWGKKPGGTLEVAGQPRAEYPGLADESLQYTATSLSDAEQAELRATTQVVSIVLAWPRAEYDRLREAYLALAALAEGRGALVCDRNAASVYSAAAWRERRLEQGWAGARPIGPQHFQVHVVPQDNGLFMLDTGGLRRFGLRDLTLLDVNRATMDAAANLVNALAQRLIEGARPDAKGCLVVRLAEVQEEGLRESLIESAYANAQQAVRVCFAAPDLGAGARAEAAELRFPDVRCRDRGECLDGALKLLFGFEDHAEQVEHGPAVLAAKAKALAALAPYRDKVKKGLPHGEMLLVKAGFPFDEGTEWMWVDVQAWSGNTLRGRLESEPEHATNVRAGATVAVKLDEIMDYMYKLTDGSFYGNEVGKVVKPELFEDLGGGRSRVR